MTARILVVDDVPTNVKLMEARLMADFFQVLTATNGASALSICQDGLCDLVLLDVMMPEMDGYEVCRRLKENPVTTHIPVIMVTSLGEPEDRVRGLEAGADDFLTKPVDDLELLTRVKSLVRLKMVTDDLRMRAASGDELAINHFQSMEEVANGSTASVKVAMVSDDPVVDEANAKILQENHSVTVFEDANEALIQIAEGDHEVVVVSLSANNMDAMRLCSHLRSLERTRNLPILVIADAGQESLVSRALELGVNDYVHRPVDANELGARLRTLFRRKRYNDCLRDSVQQTIEMAVRDPLTNLYNRRYFDNQVGSVVERSQSGNGFVSVVMIDIDHFKSINDTHGHDVGDEVIQECALRIGKAIRENDIACRYGGEEFVVIMPDTDLDSAAVVAERLRRHMGSTPIPTQSGEEITVTISVGVSTLGDSDTIQKLMKRADTALYDAKRGGRDQVVACVA